jgi:hypothetical protein
VEKAQVADTVALLIESNLVGYSPPTGQAARDGQVLPPMAFVCIRTHFDEDSVTLFLLLLILFSHDVGQTARG